MDAINKVIYKGEGVIEIPCRAPVARIYYMTAASDEYDIYKKNKTKNGAQERCGRLTRYKGVNGDSSKSITIT